MLVIFTIALAFVEVSAFNPATLLRASFFQFFNCAYIFTEHLEAGQQQCMTGISGAVWAFSEAT